MAGIPLLPDFVEEPILSIQVKQFFILPPKIKPVASSNLRWMLNPSVSMLESISQPAFHSLKRMPFACY